MCQNAKSVQLQKDKSSGTMYDGEHIGEKVFLTREEAEKAIKALKEQGGE